MKKILAILVFLIVGFEVWGESFVSEGVYYNILTSSTVSVTFRGATYTTYSNEYSGAVSIPQTVTNSGITYTVTDINTNAFYKCTGVTSVSIPNTLTIIGNYAFSGCTGLTSVVIPKSVSSLGYYAFTDCSTLKTVGFEDGTNTLTLGSTTSSSYSAYTVFANCPLDSLYLGRNLSYYSGSTYLPFSGKTTLRAVKIGGSMTFIGDSFFDTCTGLNKVLLSNEVTSIGAYAFNGCTKLTGVTLGSALGTIGDYAFKNTGMVAVVIPKSVSSLGSYAFSACTSLKTIGFEDGTTTLTLGSTSSAASSANTVFSGSPLDSVYLGRNLAYYTGNTYAPFNSNTTLRVVRVGTGATSLGSALFYNTTSLKTVVIMDGTTSIGSNVFYGCTALNSLKIGNSVSSIGEYAFSTTGLASIIVPKNVSSIGAYAFSGCPALKTVSFENGTGTLTLGLLNASSASSTVFVNCPLDSLYLGRPLNYYNGATYTPFTGKATLRAIRIGGSMNLIGDNLFNTCTGLKSAILSSNVTSIGSYAFYSCTNLKSVSLTTGLTSIGAYAFHSCPLAAEFTLPSTLTSISEYAFYNCKGLKSISLPNGLAALANYTFNGCTSLTAVTMPNSLTTIGDYTFYGCTGLTAATLGNAVSTIGQFAFCNCPLGSTFNFPSTLKTIGESAFNNCTGLKTVTLPSGMTVLSNNTFAGCTGITSMYLPGTLTNIGNSVFSGCLGIKSLVIPKSVTSIGSNSCSGCTALKTVSFETGDSTLNLGTTTTTSNLFSGCPLDSIYLGRNLSYYTNYSPFRNMTSLRKLVFGVSVSVIGDYMFSGCSNVKGLITIPEMVANIGNYAFNNCSQGLFSIKSVQLINLGQNAFFNCQLASGELILPATIMSIGVNNFNNAQSITSIHILATTPPALSKGNFANYVVYVNKGCRTSYEAAANWSENIIVDDKTQLVVNVKIPGTLASEIVQCGIMPFRVQNVKVNGTLNETDWSVIKMSMPSIYSLDMSGLVNTEIPEGQFVDNHRLVFVNFPKNLTTIGASAFESCVNLRDTLQFPTTFYALKDRAFKNCERLMSAIFTGTKTEIGSNAFYDCNTLNSLVLKKGDVSLGASAFYNCAQLVHANFPAGLKQIGAYAFYNCSALEGSLALPEGITVVSNNSFNGCTALKSLVLPSTMTIVEDRAFMDCSNLTNVTFPDNLAQIGQWAFANCSTISFLKLPLNLKVLEANAFNGCTGLQKIGIAQMKPLGIADKTFTGVDFESCILYVPKYSAGLYLTSIEWMNFYNISEDNYVEGYNITVVSNGNGSVAFDNLKMSNSKVGWNVVKGDSATFVLLPNEGYSLKSLVYNGTEYFPSVAENTFVTPKLVANANLFVNFENGITSIAPTEKNVVQLIGRDGLLFIRNAEVGKMVSVFSLEGHLLRLVPIDSKELQLRMPINQTYVVRVDDETYKIAL